jgi:hypothetical protein
MAASSSRRAEALSRPGAGTRARRMPRSQRAPRPSPPSLWSAPSSAAAAAPSGRQPFRS